MPIVARIIAAALLCCSALHAADPEDVQPQSAIKITKPGDVAPTGDFVVGYKFSVTAPIQITDIGVFDQIGDGALKGTEPVHIGLWNSQQDMLLSADLPLKTKAQDGIFYVAVKPLTLPAGDYVIACASPEDGERYWFGAEIQTASQIQWQGGLYASGKQLALPTNPAPGKAYFGPNFRFVPAGANYTPPTEASFSIDTPGDRQVFQRDEHNVASVPIVCTAPKSADRAEARAVNLESNKPTDWMPLSVGESPLSFKGSLRLPGGWYRIEFRASAGTKALPAATVDHVGVGEVFVTAGQSNSCNHGKPRQSPADDRVSACDWQTGRWRHADDPQPGAEGDGGSPWPMLGDLLTKADGVPVGFISVGVGATSVEQWLPGGDLYRRLKTALERAGPHGVRAVLWHQGEQDSVAATPADEYYHALALIIARSRHDAGWQVPWGVALVSYHPSAPAANYPAIIAGQKMVIEKEPAVFAGPATDDFHNHDWMADGVHFNERGLAAHAQGWAKALEPLLNSPPPPATGQNVSIRSGQKVAFLGDSITAYGWDQSSGYVRLVVSGLASNGIEIAPIPAGVSGNKSNDMLNRFDTDVLSKKPDWLTISCGVNDVWQTNGLSLEQYSANITQIAGKAQAAGIHVMVLTATMIGEDQAAPNNQKLIPYNNFLRHLAEERHFLLADLNRDEQDELAKARGAGWVPNRYLTLDGIHMNPRGNVMMATGVLKAFGLTNAQLTKAKDVWLDTPGSCSTNLIYQATVTKEMTLRQYLGIQNAMPRDSGNVAEMLQSLLNKEMTAVLTHGESDGIEGVKKQVLRKIDGDLQLNSDYENKK